MKFIKKYGLYICLGAMLVSLGTVSYITEFRELDEKTPVETSYTPEAVKVEKTEANEEKTQESEITETKEARASAQDNIPLAFSSPVTAGASVGYSGNEMVYSETMGDFRTHSGIDYAADAGTEVLAAAYGTVTDVSNDDYFGLTVTVDHGGGLSSVYSSLSESLVKAGDTVERGDVIAAVGNSAAVETAEGAHLQFEGRKDGEAVNPMELMN